MGAKQTQCGFCVDGVLQDPEFPYKKGDTCPHCHGTTIPGGRHQMVPTKEQ